MTGKQKFDRCKFRSKEKLEYHRQGCCGKLEVAYGYKCIKKDIVKIIPHICSFCDLYESN